MLWRGRRKSGNIEDLRGRLGGLPRIGFPGGGSHRGRMSPHTRLATAVALLVIVGIILVLSSTQPDQMPIEDRTTTNNSGDAAGASDEQREFIAVVLADTEDVWNDLFSQFNRTYPEPKLVLFKGGAGSACGFAQSATGPFYCPGDAKIYIDLGFYRELEERFKAPGDFAQAYVLAHEVGHHVQNTLGVFEDVAGMQAKMNAVERNALSVRVELQADCYAGLWAHHAQKTKQILEPGDIDEALRAASAVGDDRIQKQTTGEIVPDAFTHGTAEQRARWFRRGFEDGTMIACNTFDAAAL